MHEVHDVHQRVGITVLDIAKGLIYGEKQDDYGTALESFGNIATGWEVILGCKITPEQVTLCMDWLKTCRLVNTPGHQDSIYDKAGYVGCYEKIEVDRKKQGMAEFTARAQVGGPVAELPPMPTAPVSDDEIDSQLVARQMQAEADVQNVGPGMPLHVTALAGQDEMWPPVEPLTDFPA